MRPQVLVRPENLSPSNDDFEVIGAFNPGAASTSGGVALLVRVAERPRASKPGFTGLPRWESGRGTVVDWVRDDELQWIDPRVVRCTTDGLVRLPFISHLRVVRRSDATGVSDFHGPDFLPDSPLEEFGVEDPRITLLDDRYFITYVAVSRHGVATALASTDDFRTFERHGVIYPPENKDVVLFPERIAGQYVAVHRPVSASGFARPEMWLARSPDLVHWGGHQHLLGGGATWDSGRIGAGPPPVRIPQGWLLIYHGTARPGRTGKVGVYSAGAVLLDYDDPSRVIARSRVPFMTPLTDFERDGFVSNVVFPTGIVVDGDSLTVYYGAADTYSAVLRLPIEQILESLAPSAEFT
jgi:predicted GH43/DUF377 family glycosyl hydrolase